MKFTTSILISCALIGSGLSAQSGGTVLKGATIYPVASSPIENGVIVMQAGKIAAIGDDKTPIPNGAQVIDCGVSGVSIAFSDQVAPRSVDRYTFCS